LSCRRNVDQSDDIVGAIKIASGLALVDRPVDIVVDEMKTISSRCKLGGT
jgi:hypothetical protein